MSAEFIDIYVAKLPDAEMSAPLIPRERDEEVSRVGCERVRREKYFAWRLLEYALNNTLGVAISDAKLKKTGNGKWISPLCELSISHSSGAIAVALSDKRVGIDIETVRRTTENFASRALTDGEQQLLSSLSERERECYIIERWCAKEAVFKMRGEAALIPQSIDTIKEPVSISRIHVGEVELVFALSSESCAEPCFREVDTEEMLNSNHK